MMEFKTLGQFIIEKQEEFPFAKGELSRLLRDIGIAAKVVNREVNKAGLAEILGPYGQFNVQGEEQQKLDVLADKEFISALKRGGECCYIASEEHEEGLDLSSEGKYIVCIDPLDGSSNIDVNISIGTIFSIYRRKSSSGRVSEEDVLQQGVHQVAAGYVLYGSSTMLVYTTGHGVNGFTLDPSIGEFCLSHPMMRIPENGNTYSINQGNFINFPPAIKEYVKMCQEENLESGRPYSLRYIGSLVADLHRTILKGGIFMYPESVRHRKGKLRLMYECNPMAFILEQAGGRASTGKERILEIQPDELHQRTPLVIGSSAMVLVVEKLYADIGKIAQST
ncbi:class 1 fructose-bisphosphatase [Sphingobacterium sp. lm-10]|uniref:class 1 fructose-bisphosphatase n=1 Tax=Sphingobacterium sp. lm-10 TaxID=2944904 RepID=UPI002020934E|nr:class 1 fructose-bisphosphatase [Sphingobacterium sp. lm-10]